jgi:hypothetical protein
MGIIGNIQNNIVVIYEIKSWGKFIQTIYIEQITILLIVKKLKKPDNITVLPLGGIVYFKTLNFRGSVA